MKTTFAATLALYTAITIAAPTGNAALEQRETLFSGPARITISEHNGNSQVISVPTDGRDHHVTDLTGGLSSILFVENDGTTEATDATLVDLDPTLFCVFKGADGPISINFDIESIEFDGGFTVALEFFTINCDVAPSKISK